MKLIGVSDDEETLSVSLSEEELALINNSVLQAAEFINDERYKSTVGRDKQLAWNFLRKMRGAIDTGTGVSPRREIVDLGGWPSEKSAVVTVTKSDLTLVENSVRGVLEQIPDWEYHALIGSEKDVALTFLGEYRSLRRELIPSERGDTPELLPARKQRVFAIVRSDLGPDGEAVVDVVEILPTFNRAEKETMRLKDLSGGIARSYSIHPTWWYPEGA
ncbi:hypothetical protein ITJ38_17900 [Agreia pratensis]|uniref:hypothetical protein n=1 Tax=Agreia pratensis TaxID=150121 RepID=UPI00188CA4C9|nr:hypothetical protein [Agreia pratensis]MBF4636289.1 hypothetical protein [Agreia pratensis]